MKPLVEKILRSGLIDKATTELMEKYGMLEEGSSEQVNEDALKNATRERLEEITESLAEEVEREQALKETYLDLERLRWPVRVKIGDRLDILNALIDRQGRYYFRYQDAKLEWFTPGSPLYKGDAWRSETVLEAQLLYIEENPVAIQVTTSEVV